MDNGIIYDMQYIYSSQCAEYGMKQVDESLKGCYSKVYADFAQILDWLNNTVHYESPNRDRDFKVLIELCVATFTMRRLDILVDLLESEVYEHDTISEFIDAVSITQLQIVYNTVIGYLSKWEHPNKETEALVGGWITETVFIIYFKEVDDADAYNNRELLEYVG